ncbi:YtxH domain-containing protein [Nocardioides houyundeii]|uniref:YtxH domain-containing protein n=1 Tax=Nocardioides houyundeii TaxID=2045452 RepID=UPI0013154E14|nr:YtxH domain-containing protein [Nocardioides houyundeii]
MRKSTLLLAMGAGYVLGAKAGRERYEQIRSGFNKVRQNPKVQATAQQAADAAKDKAPVVKEKLTGAAGAAAEKVKPGGHKDEKDGLETQLNPENVALQDNPYPQGTLP